MKTMLPTRSQSRTRMLAMAGWRGEQFFVLLRTPSGQIARITQRMIIIKQKGLKWEIGFSNIPLSNSDPRRLGVEA